MTRRPEAPAVLALRALGLGDLLTGVPALRALRRAFPDHEVVLATPPSLHALAGRAQVCDRCLAVDGLEAASTALAAERRPAVAVNLHGRGPQSHVALRSTAPCRLLGFALEGSSDGPPWRDEEHERVRWCRMLEWYGVDADPLDLAVEVEPVPDAFAGVTVVHPGASSAARRWPPGRWARVTRHLEARGHRVVVTGDQRERGLALGVARRAGLPDDRCVAGRTDPVGLVDLVGGARLVLSGDTGVAHVASATGVPSVVLFGPVSPERWGPPHRPQHHVLWHGRVGDPHAATVDAGLAAIAVDDVLRAVDVVEISPVGA